jgi:hypothetical protein
MAQFPPGTGFPFSHLLWLSGLENRDYGRRDSSCWPRGILYPQKLALTSLTSGGRSVGIVRSRTQATEFSFFMNLRASLLSAKVATNFDDKRRSLGLYSSLAD